MDEAANADRRTFLEFFAGIGLVRLGLEAQGWSPLYANDIAEDKRAMYADHFGESDAEKHFHLGDVHEVDATTVPTATLATASFPCTDLSLAGERKGLKGKESSAFFGFARVLEDMGERRPPLVMMENVLGLINSKGGADFEAALRTLNELGYVVDAVVLDAKWFTPQSRPRLFIVGVQRPASDDETENEDPPALMAASRLRPDALRRFIMKHPDIRWNLRRAPSPPSHCEKTLSDIIEELPDDAPEWWSIERSEYLYSQMSDTHRATADDWIDKPHWSYGTIFRRVRKQSDGIKKTMAELRSDGLAGCLRTPKGGSGRQILFRAGFGRYDVRLITPRECARLMGADDFTINAGTTKALFGFGDAVCVPAVAWMAEHYLNPMLDELDL
jgi:DNA (cytosine-5)-methyltransferase 1